MSCFAGVVIEGSFIPYELLYYEIPSNLNVEVGDRVLVPFGPKDRLKVAYVIRLNKELKGIDKSRVKRVKAILEKRLFSQSIATLFEFTGKTFLIPLHSFINRIYGTFVPHRIEEKINVLDKDGLTNLLGNVRSSKKEILLGTLLEKSSTTLSLLKRKSKLEDAKIKGFLRELEGLGYIEIQEIAPTSMDVMVKIKDEALFDEFLHSRRISKSVKEILLRVKKNGIIHFDDVIYGVKKGSFLVLELIERGILEVFYEKEKEKTKTFVEKMVIDGGSLEERTKFLIEHLKTHLAENGKVLIVVNEHALIEKIRTFYEEAFPYEVSISYGGDKGSIRRDIRKNKKIYISTPFSLFVDIVNLEYIIIEDASSKYHMPNEYLNFDTRIVAYKRSELEHVSLLFSTYSLDDTLLYFSLKKQFLLKELKNLRNQNKRIIDMRKEYKSKHLSPVSRYLESKIRKALELGMNVALVLNRKPYSTFIICRECGYVHRCKVCGTPLHYDKENGVLFCPVCGYTEPPISVCPRCGSVSISYLGYGIQKLSRDLKNIFKDTRIEILERGSTGHIVDASLYSKTIFLGTEFLFSHLILKGVGFIAFVSADTFLNGSNVNTSIEAMKFFRQAAFEVYPEDVFLQTYSADNPIFSFFKNDSESGFLKEELNYRRILGYPPYQNLVELYFKETIDVELIKKQLPESRVLGPVEKFESGKRFYAISIRTATHPQTVYEVIRASNYLEHLAGARVYPAPELIYDSGLF